jgi:hypothetical protein
MGLFHPLLTHPYSSQRPEVMMYLLVYVDNIILISSSDAAADHFVSSLSGDFAVKDLGALHYFLGLEVSQSSVGLTLTQHKYSMDLLHRANMLTLLFLVLIGCLLLMETLFHLMMLLSTAASLVVCNTSLSPDQMSLMQSTVCVSIFMHP